jgi:excisionase family DNA binding protein
MIGDQYVSIAGVAKYYSVSVSTVRAWIRTGKLTSSDFLKLGNTYRFKIADVDAALRRMSSGVLPETVAEATTPDSAVPVQLELNFDNPDKDI